MKVAIVHSVLFCTFKGRCRTYGPCRELAAIKALFLFSQPNGFYADSKTGADFNRSVKI